MKARRAQRAPAKRRPCAGATQWRLAAPGLRRSRLRLARQPRPRARWEARRNLTLRLRRPGHSRHRTPPRRLRLAGHRSPRPARSCAAEDPTRSRVPRWRRRAPGASLLDAELVRQGLRPSRSFSDGAALPASFRGLRDQWSASASDPVLNPDLASRNAQNRDAVGRALGSEPPSASTTPQPSIRPEIGLGGSANREQADRSRRGFDAEAEVSRSADGTVSTKKSLLLQSGRQVAADAGATLDEAKDC